MIATIPSATLMGIDGHLVSVEVHVSSGVPTFALVGLPDAACREAKDRVRAAALSSGLPWELQRVTVNLAPSNLRKNGSGLDLAIAIGVLVANGVIEAKQVADMGFVAELGLDGSLRAVPGIVPLVDAIPASTVVVPSGCQRQASLVGRHTVRCASNLRELVAALKGEAEWTDDADLWSSTALPPAPDLADVRGQPLARWALEVAAAGGHNIIFNGSPGSGKTMLAKRLVGLLPALDTDTALLATKIHSAAGLLSDDAGLLVAPPFRSPHHTSSMVSLTGGGSTTMRPGEASLAHGGVLFLDEMSEFPARVLDAMRQPLEEGTIHVARAHASVVFPARFLCIGATNPCPCGEGLAPGGCRCSEAIRRRYSGRLSGPLIDRFDIRVRVERPRVDQFFATAVGESTAVVADRVADARQRALARGAALNSFLTQAQLDQHAPLGPSASLLLRSEMRQGRLTARGLHRVHRVARTLADLDGSSVLSDEHVGAALQLRPENNGTEQNQ